MTAGPPPLRALCRDCLWRSEAPAGRRRCAACGGPRLLVHAELERLHIAHVDCDAFYASVEKRDRPELADLPVVVGGGVRGVVTAACYVARTYGVRSAMPMFKALKLCPAAVVIRPDFAKYKAASRAVMGHLRRLTPLVQPLSLDEAWLDLSGTERLNGGPPAWQLARAQAQIARDTGLNVSVGLAANKFLAKIASDLDKPRGFAVIGVEEAQRFLADRPVAILPGVGPAAIRGLEAAGLRTVGDLARAEPRELVRRLGAHGLRLHALAHGRDARPVDPDSERKACSAETTFNADLSTLDQLEDRLWPCCEKVAARARADGFAGRAVVLKLKTADFRILTRRRTLPAPTQTARTLFATARDLLRPQADGRPFRLIGAGLTDLVESRGEVGHDLFGAGEARTRTTEAAIDGLRARFGQAAVVSGRAVRRGCRERAADLEIGKPSE